MQYKRKCHELIKKKKDLLTHVSKWSHLEMPYGLVFGLAILTTEKRVSQNIHIAYIYTRKDS